MDKAGLEQQFPSGFPTRQDSIVLALRLNFTDTVLRELMGESFDKKLLATASNWGMHFELLAKERWPAFARLKALVPAESQAASKDGTSGPCPDTGTDVQLNGSDKQTSEEAPDVNDPTLPKAKANHVDPNSSTCNIVEPTPEVIDLSSSDETEAVETDGTSSSSASLTSASVRSVDNECEMLADSVNLLSLGGQETGKDAVTPANSVEMVVPSTEANDPQQNGEETQVPESHENRPTTATVQDDDGSSQLLPPQNEPSAISVVATTSGLSEAPTSATGQQLALGENRQQEVATNGGTENENISGGKKRGRGKVACGQNFELPETSSGIRRSMRKRRTVGVTTDGETTAEEDNATGPSCALRKRKRKTKSKPENAGKGDTAEPTPKKKVINTKCQYCELGVQRQSLRNHIKIGCATARELKKKGKVIDYASQPETEFEEDEEDYMARKRAKRECPGCHRLFTLPGFSRHRNLNKCGVLSEPKKKTGKGKKVKVACEANYDAEDEKTMDGFGGQRGILKKSLASRSLKEKSKLEIKCKFADCDHVCDSFDNWITHITEKHLTGNQSESADDAGTSGNEIRAGVSCLFDNCKEIMHTLPDFNKHMGSHMVSNKCFSCDDKNCSLIYSDPLFLITHKVTAHPENADVVAGTSKLRLTVGSSS